MRLLVLVLLVICLVLMGCGGDTEVRRGINDACKSGWYYPGDCGSGCAHLAETSNGTSISLFCECDLAVGETATFILYQKQSDKNCPVAVQNTSNQTLTSFPIMIPLDEQFMSSLDEL